MAGGVYSTRFLTITTHQVQQTFTVPSGKRVVIKQVCANNPTAAAGTAAAYLMGLFLWRVSVPANSALQTDALYAVAYEGETVGGYVGVSGMTLFVFGYLFEESAAARDAHAELLAHTVEVPLVLEGD
jgi:hypothetical protein